MLWKGIRAAIRRTRVALAEPPQSAVDLATYFRQKGATIGSDVFFGPEVLIEDWCAHFFTAEDGVVMAPRVTIILHDSALSNVCEMPVRLAPVTLKRRCYIGAGSLILPGVTIGEQAIIGAGSLVTKDIAPRTLAYGVPAKEICSIDDYQERFTSRMKQDDGFYLHFGAWRDVARGDRDAYIAGLYQERVQQYLKDHGRSQQPS